MQDGQKILEDGALAFAITLAAGPIVVAAARRLRVLDFPSHRSSHHRPVPRAGGIAPAAGALVALFASAGAAGHARTGLVVAASSFGVLGLVDDVRGVPALSRLTLQLVASIMGATWLLSGLSGPPLWKVLFATGVVVWLVAYVNAFNFMDGIDGISVVQAIVAGLTWYAVGRSESADVLAAAGVIVAGAAIGFAPFNVVRARVFLGDVGSYFLGAWLAAAAVVGLRAGVPAEAVLAPLALYLSDTGVTLIRRVARGDTWYLPHRDHAYQQLVILGWSHLRTSSFVAAVIAVASGLGAVSLVGSRPLRVVADVVLVGLLGAYLATPQWLRRRRDAALADSTTQHG